MLLNEGCKKQNIDFLFDDNSNYDFIFRLFILFYRP